MDARAKISLACAQCTKRNYRTSKRPNQQGALELKKFCPTCNVHTLHRETK